MEQVVRIGLSKELLAKNSIFEMVIALDLDHFPQPWTINQWEELKDSEDTLLVAIFENSNSQKALGFALFGLNSYEKLAHLYKVSVHSDWREKGLSSKILEKSFKWLSASNMDKVFLEVSVNNAAAIGLYQKYGFEILSRKKKFYTNSDDAYAMQKYIDGSLSS